MEIKVASSNLSLNDLLSQISKELKAGQTLQLFDPKLVINRTHLEGAYLNALTAFKNKTNRTKTVGMEMLLFASMSNQIGEALKICGAKSNKEFIIFANDSSAFAEISKLLSKSSDFKPSKVHAAEVAAKYGIRTGDDMDSFILQKMAVSRLED